MTPSSDASAAGSRTARFRQVAQRLGSQLLRHEPLLGGVSAGVERLLLATDGGASRWVVWRCPGGSELAAGPIGGGIGAASEHQVLTLLATAGFAVPKPLLLDMTCTIFDRPYLVLPFVEGTTTPANPEDAVDQMAAFLGRLHRLDPAELELPNNLERRVSPWPLAVAPCPALQPRQSARLAALARHTEEPRPALLHGDLWPGNVLWQDGALRAVIDWEDAAVGDPLSDLAGSRLEVVCAYGSELMERFTTRYRLETARRFDDQRLAAWDVYVSTAALSAMATWGLAADVEARMRARAERFRDHALSVACAG